MPPKAKKPARAKVTPKKALAIFNAMKKPKATQRKVAAKYGVSRSCVYDIHHGRSWSHVTGA